MLYLGAVEPRVEEVGHGVGGGPIGAAAAELTLEVLEDLSREAADMFVLNKRLGVTLKYVKDLFENALLFSCVN